MRRFIIGTNCEQLQIENANVIKMDINDLEVMFNQDCLNVLNEEQYKKQLSVKYLYGVEVEFDNYLTGYRKFLKDILTADPELIVIYDVSIKRYINQYELNYFADNKLLPSKLFNVEIESNQERTKYSTIGLESIGLKEIIFESSMYLNEEDFQFFKAVATNYVIGKQATININLSNINYRLQEIGDNIVFDYNRPPRINEFFIRDDMYLNNIRYDLIKFHWPLFLKLHDNCPHLGNFVVNKSKVYDIHNFEVGHIEEFAIVCDGITYNQDNLFYAYKYL